ncbi:MAG: hypothetical protein Q8R15_03620 [Candidatus Micrarchaeota archaeon]|nr:hypothetical protein [Candidatus Micrarchaeota archaeon]
MEEQISTQNRGKTTTPVQTAETASPVLPKRTGKTREHYLQQKSQQFAYFKINKEDATKLESMQFNIYDFISASFAFSQPKKELAIGVLNALKTKPSAFSELVIQLNAKKSSLFLVCLSLERAGLIERKGKGEPYHLVTSFSDMLASYAKWWKFWAEH